MSDCIACGAVCFIAGFCLCGHLLMRLVDRNCAYITEIGSVWYAERNGSIYRLVKIDPENDEILNGCRD